MLKSQAEVEINPFLSGNYAPVHDELTVSNLEVIGEIPKDMPRIISAAERPLTILKIRCLLRSQKVVANCLFLKKCSSMPKMVGQF